MQLIEGIEASSGAQLVMEAHDQGIPPQQDEKCPDYCNEAVFRRNCLPTRSYFIPDTSMLLNGSWDFHYADTPLAAPEPGSLGRGLDESLPWGKITVPGHWQLQGHGHPWYTNVQYPFPVNPPYVPSENPTGTYRRIFSVPLSWNNDDQLRLRFEGVDSAYHVWVNSVLVGYAQGSRNPSEFDISKLVDRGKTNELWVRVYQWSDGSYIEDQDQWWLSGIFRDVYLLSFPVTNRIEDWFFRTDLDNRYRDGTLHVDVDVLVSGNATLRFTLSHQWIHGGGLVGEVEKSLSSSSTVHLEMKVNDPHKWTAETPYLYLAGLILRKEDGTEHKVQQRIGFRKVEIRDGLMTVNGKAILLHGVNRHEHHPLFGRAVPLEWAKRDLIMMKQNNINALRTSHQPNNPKLLDFCDELGLWVIDEADLECHGFEDAVWRARSALDDTKFAERGMLCFDDPAQFTSDNPAWEAAYLDRMRSMVQRDKNHPSIIIWSLGNESFYGRNHKAMYHYAKKFDPGRLIHYEGDSQAETTDLFSYMYPSPERLIQYAQESGVKDGKFTKPVILCEYGHAMGNGPGWLQDYLDVFRNYERVQGGFIWEWANHGLWKEDSNGQNYYGYGGDFGDEPNDGTFVMDGLLNSKHEATPGLIELKKVMQPAGFVFEMDRKNMVIENRYDFIDLGHLAATYKIEAIGGSTEVAIIGTGELPLPHLKPGQRAEVKLPQHSLPELLRDFKVDDCEVVWTVSLKLRSATLWAEAGHELAWSQCTERYPSLTKEQLLSVRGIQASPLQCTQTVTELRVKGQDFHITFDRARGHLTSWRSGNDILLEIDPRTGAAIIPGFYRPVTDNDRATSMRDWKRWRVDAIKCRLIHMSHRRNPSGPVEVQMTQEFSPPSLCWKYVCDIIYSIDPSGALSIRVKGVPEGALPPDIPRIGLNLRASQDLDQAQWFGRGPGESYPDKKASQRIGVFSVSTLKELHTPYDVPQEYGNRIDTRWVRFTGSNRQGQGFKAHRINPGGEVGLFSFVAKRHSDVNIEEAKHPCDLVEDSATLLRLDAKVAGVGTGACGPAVREDLKVRPEKFEFTFLLERI